MGYVLTAYGMVFVGVALYGVHLSRERRRLLRSLAEGETVAGS